MGGLIPVVHLSFCSDNPAAGRWDQEWVERIINQEEWKIPGGPSFFSGEPDDLALGGIIVFPAGHYAEHCGTGWPLRVLEATVDQMPWSVVIATSDEGSSFPWQRFKMPDDCHLWVMTPRPENTYPPGTFFIGEGSPMSPERFEQLTWSDCEKSYDMFFSGQVNHERREQMMEAIDDLAHLGLEHFVETTDGFAQGLPPNVYATMMSRSKVVPCPSGQITQDSFRFFEALEAQAVPIPDAIRPGDSPGHGYWDMIFPDGMPFAPITYWEELALRVINWRRPHKAAQVSAWWQDQKRRVAYRLYSDLMGSEQHAMDLEGDEAVAVIIVTSPHAGIPDTDMIEDTLYSVRDRFPNSEIFIGIDGLRIEDKMHAEAYHEYARRLCALTNSMINVLPIVFTEHKHQSGMVRHILDNYIKSEYTLFVEHDTPLCGEIDPQLCVELMRRDELGILRFTHEAGVLEEHEHLFLETTSELGYVRTIQYSARPHLIETSKFRDLMATYFGRDAKTFLEDTLYGALQYLPPDEIPGPLREDERNWLIWKRHRMAVYAPEGTWKRSEHSDGRAGGPKHPTWIAYDGERPEGGPPEGVMVV